jgi:ATP-binding cassette subfamily B protein
VAQGVLPIATVYLAKGLVAAIKTGAGMAPVLGVLALLVLVMLASESLRALTRWVRTVQSERVKDHVSGLIHSQSLEVDLAFYESPEFFDHLHRAQIDAVYRPLELLENLGGLVQNGITLVAMALVLLPYGAWLPLALVVSTLPALFVVLHHRLKMHDWRLKATPDERRAWYYQWVMTSRESAAELRLFDLGGHFKSRFQDTRSRLREQYSQLVKSQSKAELAAGVAALGVTGLTMGWMVWRAAHGRIGLGDLTLLYQAFSQGQRLMRTLLENLGELYSNSLFLENMVEFLKLTPSVTDGASPGDVPVPPRQQIDFDRVTFRYPGSQRTALDRFTLRLVAGRTTAIVGPNGAGKSTLIKLLTRLYDPQEGAVRLDGRDLRELRLADLRRAVTVMFQEPAYYNDTVAENIRLGDIRRTATGEELRDAAAAAGADVVAGRLPDGLDTLLGKWFAGGTDLSTGEWQRIALARAFYRQSPIIVLDEPTSAMDSWAETEWLKNFRRLAEGKTVLVITHRFTTARHADVIHVMDDGRIVESGSHTELLAQGGRYAAAWREMEGASRKAQCASEESRR